MFNNIIFSNKYVVIVLEEDQVYIKVLQKKYELSDFQEILKSFPRIKITRFIALKSAVTNAIEQLVSIGEYKPIVEVSLSNDHLKAYANINLTTDEFNQTNKKDLIERILLACKEEKILYGIDFNELVTHMKPLEKFLVANATLPVVGDDAIVKLYEIEDIKPQIFEDGKVNHYELNLINKVNEGDWVGERIEPTLGIPGKTVLATPIPAIPGKQIKLIYDRKTISEELSKDATKTILTSKKLGAVVFENGLLSVSNYLEIDGKVSFETGNIDFDGFVEVKHSIEDNFSVRADNDIQVLGNIGIGGIDTIESRDGNIYIKGGIAGKNKAKIICNGDLYTKFASDCTIECQGTVHIGYYAMNTTIIAKEVILESFDSKIIGGHIEAEVRVVAGEIGNRAEIPTSIHVLGFDRIAYKEEYDKINSAIDHIKSQMIYLNQKLSIYSPNQLDHSQKKAYSELVEAYENFNKKLKMLYEKKKRYISYLHSKGDGEVRVNQCIYSNVKVVIKNHSHYVDGLHKLPISYFVLNNEFKTL